MDIDRYAHVHHEKGFPSGIDAGNRQGDKIMVIEGVADQVFVLGA